MKLSPLFIFLILLVVLVLSVIFSNWLPLSNNREGLIQLYTNDPPLSKVKINKYSKTKEVTKLYDSLFFDTSNGNLIEVNGSVCYNPDCDTNLEPGCTAEKCDVITNKDSIDKIWITFTDTQSKVKNSIFYEGQHDSPQSSYKYSNVNSFWSYNSNNLIRTKLQNGTYLTNSYQVLYISWDDIKFLHIMDLSRSTNLTSYICSSTTDSLKYYNANDNLGLKFPSLTYNYTISDYNPLDYAKKHPNSPDLFVIERDYLHYDSINRKIIVINGGNASIYSAGTDVKPIETDTATIKSDTLNEEEFKSAMIKYRVKNDNTMYILSVIYKKITIIIITTYKPDYFTINNVCIFDSEGKIRFKSTDSLLYEITNNKDGNYIDYGNLNDISNINDNKDYDDTDDYKFDYDNSGGDYHSDYYKWFWYWKAQDYNNNKSVSDDYILKTQVIPPVCPTCPSCHLNNNELCTNCGGNGGSGTLINGLYNVGSGLNNNLNAVGSGLYNAGSGLNKNMNAVGSALYNAGSGINNNLNAVGSGINNNLNAVGSGINNNLNAVGSGINNNLNAVGSGLYNAGSGLNNNLNAVGSGLYNAGSGLNNNLNAVGSGLYNAGSGLNNNLNAVGSGLYNAGSGLNNNLNAVGSGLYTAGSGLNTDLNANQPGLIQTQNQNNLGQSNRVGQYNAINPGIDNYSAYGALSSKGGNFIPITNSFSAFGK